MTNLIVTFRNVADAPKKAKKIKLLAIPLRNSGIGHRFTPVTTEEGGSADLMTLPGFEPQTAQPVASPISQTHTHTRDGKVCTYLLEVIADNDRVHTAGAEVCQEQAYQNGLSAIEITQNVRD